MLTADILGDGPPINLLTYSPLTYSLLTTHSLTLAWNPAALSALTNSPVSKYPLTVKVLAFGLAVSSVMPLIYFAVILMALQQAPRQLWIPVSVRLLTLP